jgi:hypothetical protein
MGSKALHKRLIGCHWVPPRPDPGGHRRLPVSRQATKHANSAEHPKEYANSPKHLISVRPYCHGGPATAEVTLRSPA